MPPRSRHLALPSIVAAGVLVAASLSAASPAAAASAYPTPPTSVKLTAIGTSAVTVTSKRAQSAQRYAVFLSTVKSDLYTTSLAKKNSRRIGASAASPTITVRNLAYHAAPYYYRYATKKTTHLRVAAIKSFSLRPAAPTSVQVKGAGTRYVTWKSQSATSYQIAQSTSRDMRQNAAVRTIRGTHFVYSPYGLTANRTYFFRVRAVNGASASAWSAVASGTPTSATQTVRVGTYNILYQGASGRPSGGETYATWARRRTPAAAVLGKGNPDVVAVQEAVCMTKNDVRTIQADGLRTSLNAQLRARSFTLARTETLNGRYCPKAQYGNHILYDSKQFAAAGDPNGAAVVGHVPIGSCKGKTLYAVYQLLRSLTTRATFLFVSTHTCAGVSSAMDSTRRTETNTLLDNISSMLSKRGLSGTKVVYAGDWNSQQWSYHPNDGPGFAMRAHGLNDAGNVAQGRSGQRYNSFNGYRRTPPAQGVSIDRVFVSPGVALRGWAQLLNLSSGRFAGKYIPSDHNPVVVTADVPRP